MFHDGLSAMREKPSKPVRSTVLSTVLVGLGGGGGGGMVGCWWPEVVGAAGGDLYELRSTGALELGLGDLKNSDQLLDPSPLKLFTGSCIESFMMHFFNLRFTRSATVP